MRARPNPRQTTSIWWPALTATQPGQPGSATLRQESRVAVSELGFQFVHGQVFRGREGHRFDAPAHVSGGDRVARSSLPGAAHAVGQPFGEHQTVLRRAVIVFARANVATGAVEMDVQRRRDSQLSKETCESRKVRIGNSGAVVTLRMRGKVDSSHREVASSRTSPPVPETRASCSLKVDVMVPVLNLLETAIALSKRPVTVSALLLKALVQR